MTSNWSVPLVSVAVTFSMKTLYAIGTRVSLTSWAFAHVSIMSSEASWMGFFMYPTLSSRSCAWAEKRPVERARPIAVAAQSPMKRRCSGIDPSSNRAVSWMSAGLNHHTPLPGPRQCGRPPSSGLAAIQVPKHRPFQGRPDARGRPLQPPGDCGRSAVRASGGFPTLIFLYDFRMWRSLACVVIIAVWGVVHARARESPALLCSAKEIVVIVGSSAGGGYDFYAGLLSRHMPKHIPGKPAMVVTNMGGAGSNAAAA